MALDFVKVDKNATSYKDYCEKGKWLEYSDDIDRFFYGVKDVFPERAEILYQLDNLRDTVFTEEHIIELRDVAAIMKYEIVKFYEETQIMIKSCKFLEALFLLCDECIKEGKKIVAVVD